MREFDLKVEVKEIPIDQVVENTGQIPGVPRLGGQMLHFFNPQP